MEGRVCVSKKGKKWLGKDANSGLSWRETGK